MSYRTSYMVFASGFLFLGMHDPASAQNAALSSCDPATGLTPGGQQCVTLTPVDPTRYQTQISGEGSTNYRPVNVGELADTYQCDPSRGNNSYANGGGALLIEDCGQPLNLDPSTFKEFVGYSGNAPAPAPLPAAPAPAPVQVLPPPPPPPAPVIPAVTAPVPNFAAAGLGNAGLIAAGLGAAVVVGIAAIAISDDDDDNSATATTN